MGWQWHGLQLWQTGAVLPTGECGNTVPQLQEFRTNLISYCYMPRLYSLSRPMVSLILICKDA
jgi:hypothetical protein